MRFSAVALGFAVLSVHAEGREAHWAYVPPTEVAIPEQGDRHPIDALLEGAWKKAGLKSSALAPSRQWVERAAYTLTGLPATEEQIRKVEASPDEATWKALIEELLASPAYGERWARHWMDVARYADTRGYNFDQDNRYPFAYTYRDWLIRAFNEDMPYERFIKLQMAADLLTDKSDHPDLAALGFLTVGPRAGHIETVDDRVDVVTRGFLSTTVSCARCHDHKFDPITIGDYYSLYSIFDNINEPEEKPVIGTPADEVAFREFNEKIAEWEAGDRAANQAIVDQLHAPESFAVYLDLAWVARKEGWNAESAGGESFKRGRYRPRAVIAWKTFLDEVAWGENANARLKEWAAEMDAADDAGRLAVSKKLADEWAAAPEGSELKELSKRGTCPLSYDASRMPEFHDAEDGNQKRQRNGQRTRLLTEHPGSPPRAMSLSDRDARAAARIMDRGNPAALGEPYDSHWLSFLGGERLPDGRSPRLSLAEKIADPKNPLTARVMVNRVWAWHFGEALTDPGDFGMQVDDPVLRPLMDWLALRFIEKGGSVKELHREILSSRSFRLASDGPVENVAIDEGNTLFWKWNRRRVDFESMRDRLLVSSGALNTAVLGGRSVSLDQHAADTRRSLYAFVDRYALSNTFISFDLPHPDHHSPKRVETTVPQQALYFLNGPLLLRQATGMVNRQDFLSLPDAKSKVAWLYQKIYHREPSATEANEAVEWISSARDEDYQPRMSGAWEVRYAIDDGQLPADTQAFPIFADGVWKTGPDPATAPVRWLNAGAGGGHASAGHTLILRWRALSAGEVKMVGNIKRSSNEGATLAWNLAGTGVETLDNQPLPPGGDSLIDGSWRMVKAGDTVDFMLRAPEGDGYGGVSWQLKILGRENTRQKEQVVGDFKLEFPMSDTQPALASAGDPWADLVQMLWASNEFHFID